MGRGRPISTKCPKCRRGQWGYDRPERGVMIIGHELRNFRGKGQGHGTGAPRFVGHRAMVECLDCGHRWLSTLDGVRWWDKERIVERVQRGEGS